jgi:ketosteroid isomerase-like protein
MKQFFLLLFFFLSPSLLAQEQNPKIEYRKQELMNIDAQFSNLSETRGVNEAFLSYLSDDCVLLRPNTFPIVGKEISKAKYFSRPDSGYTLTWKPLYSDVAESGELGYTYGIYEFKAMDPEGKPIVGTGTYVSIWKKDQFGNWKLVLDTGDEGLEPNKL